MQQGAEQYETSMCAVVKLSNEMVEDICKKYNEVYPVNFNCPGQVTVAGLTSQIPEFSAEIKENGGRAIPLKVGGGFHSPFMNEASIKFAKELENVDFFEPKITLYSNVTALPYTENAKELLAKQICSPVRWEKLINNMIDSGIDTFIEIGPGKTLINMIKKINENVKVYSLSDIDTILAEVK